mgnify:CR=1 FL=1
MSVQVNNQEYLNIKSQVLSGDKVIRIEVTNKQMHLKDLKSVIVDGAPIEMTKEAVKGLTKSMGISGAFIKTIKSAYGEDNEDILKEILSAIKSKKSANLTLVFHVPSNKITNIYITGTKLITDDQYFKSLESIIETTPGAYLRNIYAATNGDISAVVANPALEFQFGGLKDEVFTGGMTLDLNTTQMSTSFFTERLVCSNGMKTTNKLCSKRVSSTDKVPKFMSAILDADYHIDSISAFKARIDRCYHTRASLAEVLAVETKLLSLFKGNNLDLLLNHMSSAGIRAAFGNERLENSLDHKFLRTNLTIWELTNEVTAISSKIERERLPITEGTNMRLQILGGDLMFNAPDLAPSNIRQIF